MDDSGYTLGISLGHDSGVALLKNNEIVFAANEERYSRVKGSSGFPLLSLNYLLSNYDIKIDRVALDGRIVAPHGDDAAYRFERELIGMQFAASNFGLDSFFLGNKLGHRLLQGIYLVAHSIKRESQNRFFAELLELPVKIKRVDHHMAHAASIAFPKGDASTDGLVITLDGVGEGICSRTLELKGGKFKTIDYQPALASPALMYGYVTKVLGYKINRHEGKLTGLAAYGDSEQTAKIISNYFFVRENGKTFASTNIKYGPRAIEKLKKELANFTPEDIASGVQKVLEDNVVAYVRYRIQNSPNSKLYLSGGAFANVKLNQRIAEIPGVNDIIVAPNMGDGGLALGAASLVHPFKINLDSLYLGSDIKDSEESDKLQLVKLENSLEDEIAKLLFNKKVIAISRGRMEYGPRALGNRSILYSATDASVNSWLNKKLKRTEFMPFAPVVRDIDADKNFHLKLAKDRYKYMTITVDVTDYCKTTAPAVVHIDGTARPQILTMEDNKFVYDILTSYSKYCENAILVNTSFNMHEEPIVRTTSEAVNAFLSSGIDYIVINNNLYTRK